MKTTHDKCLVSPRRKSLGLALIVPLIALQPGCARDHHQSKGGQMMMAEKCQKMMEKGMMMRDKGTMMMDMGKMMMTMPDKGKMMMECPCCQMMMKNMASDTNPMSPGMMGNMSNTNSS